MEKPSSSGFVAVGWENTSGAPVAAVLWGMEWGKVVLRDS